MDTDGLAKRGAVPDVISGARPSVLISGNAQIGKLIIVQHATSVTINSNASPINPTAATAVPVSLIEQIESLEFQIDLLLRSSEKATARNLIATCKMAQNTIKAIISNAEYNVDNARAFLGRTTAAVNTLRALTSDAEALLVDIADLHGAARDYYSAMAEMETLVQSPTRRHSTEDLIALGTWMLNAGDYLYAERVFKAVSKELRTDGPMTPWSSDEKLMQLSIAEQFRLLWIPHETGSPQLTIQAAPALLRQAHGNYPKSEGAILHRLGRAQGDLGLLNRDRNLISRSVKTHQTAMSKTAGEYNFFVPMALYNAQQALIPTSGERALRETYELSSGLGEGARPHIHLMDARRAGAGGRYFEGIESASWAIEIWHQHPHAKGVIDALVMRAELRFKLGTTSSLQDAAADLFAARNIAVARGFDIDLFATSLLKRCLSVINGRGQARINNMVEKFESAHPRLAQQPGARAHRIIDDLTRSQDIGKDQGQSIEDNAH